MMVRALLALVFGVLCVLPAGAIGYQKTPEKSEQWYVCSLGGKPCGWMQVTVAENAEQRTHTTRLMISLRRQDSMVTSKLETTLVESLDGSVEEMVLLQKLGEEIIEERWFFLPQHIRYIVKNGNRHRTATKEVPKGEWYSTEAALRLAMETPETYSKQIPALACRVLDPSLGETPIPTRFFRQGTESIDTPAGAVATTRWLIEHEGAPPTMVWIDTQKQMVRSKAEFGSGLGALEMTRSTKDQATRTIDAPEVMIATSVVPSIASGAPRSPDRADSLVLKVRNRDGSVPTLPSIGAQKVDEEGLVHIQPTGVSPEDDGVEGAFLASVPMADITDEAILNFARRGAGHRVGDEARAEALRRAVNRHINLKNLSTAFASASETVRKKAGDCTEHAVLLVAALRAQGIPARAVNGLVWTRNVGAGSAPAYVWHMWTQALIDGEWRDFDATLVGPKGYHSGHLAVSVNDLSRVSINRAATEMLEILGELQIEILERDANPR